MIRIWTWGLVLFLAGGINAWAFNLPVSEPGDCLGEVQRVCHASGAELDLCLQTRGAEFSQECRKQMWEAHVVMEDQEGPGACANDLQRLCPGPDVKSIQKCLKNKILSLPATCQDFFLHPHSS